MTLVKSLIVASCLLGGSAVAQAQSIESVTITSDPSDVVFTVRADKALSAPTVRTSEGAVRLRFPETRAPQVIQVDGDGAAIKQVDLRAGSQESAVMRLDLGDQSKLKVEDIRLESRKHVFVVRIARDVLPALREPHEAKPVDNVGTPVVAPVVAAPVKPAAPVQKSETKVPAKAKAKAKPTELKNVMASGASSSPVPMLIAISAILAIAYGVLRLVMKKRGGEPRAAAPIDIVAQKRIGPRHQLVIVRAFGREHLLSIQGGTTTPIATNEDMEDSLGMLPRQEPRFEAALDMVTPPAVNQRIKSEPPREEKKKDEETAFGGELLRVALAQRLKEATPRSSSSHPPKAHESARAQAANNANNKDDKALSQAVAGLVRLRREARL